jgi:hypothetical protein
MVLGTNTDVPMREVAARNSTILSQGMDNPSSLSRQEKTVRHPSLVTTDLDELRFAAAAYRQLDPSEPNEAVEEVDFQSPNWTGLSTLLISSPYNALGHYLDLVDLETPSCLLAKALTALKPVRPDYATSSYTEIFDFGTILSLIRKLAVAEFFQWRVTSFYVVVFRSKLKLGIDNDMLTKLDYESHREACESGGLLKYWFGKPDSERQNLATCECTMSIIARLA